MATSRKNMSESEWKLLRDIGDMYKDIRLEAGLTQRDAAMSLGVSQGRIPVLEHGQADVMITTLKRWANLYNYDIEIVLVKREEDEFDAALRAAAEELYSDDEEQYRD